MSEPVLVVGPSWVGDMVMAQSLFMHLRRVDPAREIDVIAPAWSLPVLARMPEVRRGIALPLAHGELGLGVRRRLGHSLRPEGYGQAIVLPRSAKAALVPWHAGIKRRTGFRGEFRYGLINDMHAFDRARLDQTVKRFVALGTSQNTALPDLPQPSLRVDGDAQSQALQRLSLKPSRPVIGFMPGAEFGPAKCWPLEHFASLGRRLDAAGFDVWLFGGPKDVEPANEIVSRSGVGLRSLCGETSLADAIDLLALCRAVVSNDSGLMHVAAAVGCHVIALYGSTTPAFTPPLTADKTIHDLQLECSPCFKRECPLGHLNCLRQILPGDVAASVARAAASA